MKASAATTSFQSFLASQAAKQASDAAADDHRKQALEEQVRSEASSLLSRIKSSDVSSVSLLIAGASTSGSDADVVTGNASTDTGTASTGPSGSGIELVTYASVTKAYAAQAAHQSS